MVCSVFEGLPDRAEEGLGLVLRGSESPGGKEARAFDFHLDAGGFGGDGIARGGVHLESS